MTGSKYGVAIIAAALTATTLAPSAEANRRCGYDRYGYHPPDFSGCYGQHPYGWGFYPAYGPYPEGGYYVLPSYEGYYPADGYYCYYDNGYDLRVHRICYRAR
jgi:hypothetical protein